MDDFKRVFEYNPFPSFIFNNEGEIVQKNEVALIFLEDWNGSSDKLSEKNLKILLYQNNLGLQNIEILSQDKYYRFEVVRLPGGDFCFYGSNVTFQKNTADTLFNLIDDVHEGLFLVDIHNEGLLVEVNSTATKYLGYNREELLTLQLKDIIVDFDLKTQADWTYHANHIKTRVGSITKTVEFKRKDGTTFPVEMVVSIKHLMEKDYQLTLVRDITERLEEEEHKEQMKMNMFASAKLSHLGEMATSIAHEINNPLTVIIAKTVGLKKLLRAKDINIDKSISDLLKVEETVKRITKVIASLKNISKSLESNSFCNESLRDIIDDVTNLYVERINQLNMSFEVTGVEVLDDITVYCNRAQIAQIFISLINNACEAVQRYEDRWIRIDLKVIKQSLEISITDSGKGIPPTVVEQMFEPFFTTKFLGNGTGLGLALSHSMAKNHSGELIYDKSCKNTRFKLILPYQ